MLIEQPGGDVVIGENRGGDLVARREVVASASLDQFTR
jgi:hypothetical protein